LEPDEPTGTSIVFRPEFSILAALNKEKPHTQTEDYAWRDIASGIHAAVSVWYPDPQFASPTKTILMSPEIFGAVAGLAYTSFGS
jgi:DNA gyrase/topoisomerase IV subunit B